MTSIKSKFILLVSGLVLIAFSLPACDGNRPVAPGSKTNFTPQTCGGVLGHNTAETTTAAVNDLWFNPYVPPSDTTLLSLSVYTGSSSAVPVTFEAGVYANNLSAPTSLLVETGPQTVSGPATQWNTAPLTHLINLSGGVTYWLGFQSSNFSYRYTAFSIAYAFQPAGAYGSLPTIFTGTVSSSFVLSIYGTICP